MTIRPNMQKLELSVLRPEVHWHARGKGIAVLDVRLPALLAAIQATGTLAAAAAHIGLPYRTAWGLLVDAGSRLGAPLVEKRRGRGATLTAPAEQLVEAHARATAALAKLDLAVPVAPHAPRAAVSTGPGVSIVASHDPLLMEWCERWAIAHGVVAGIAARGSIEALSAFARGAAEIAGFHLAPPLSARDAAQYRRLLDAQRDRLIRLATREQGLIVAKGNPKKLRSLADIARRHARFVNRQRGSGTRLLIDQLLREAGVAPQSIRGYVSEEYTHGAVAAMIASGHADCALGVKAAAAQFKLDFVPLRTEAYWLAVRARAAESPSVLALRTALAGDAFARVARAMPGYAIRGAGELVPVSAAFE